MKDPLFETIYNDQILEELEKRYGPFARHHADLTADSETMLEVMTKMETKPRRGEVVMVVPNEKGQIWLHTKDFYPEGVYRLMTGGLETGETPYIALLREVEEETGFKVKIDRCLAVITHTISNKEQALPFASYVFLTTPGVGHPQLTDQGEAISDFRAVPVEELGKVARQLRSLRGRFSDWGVFRAIAHEVTLEQLRST